MYGFMDKSDFETILITWSKTEIPPKPKRKAVSIILIDICFIFMFEIKLIPFVISNIPVNKELEMFSGTFTNLHTGLNISDTKLVNPLALKIEMITENSTTKPPIIRIVDVAEDILCPRTSPKLENDIVCNLLSDLEVL